MNKKYVPLTIIKKIDGFTLKITQMLNMEFYFGHYSYYIEDGDGNIVKAGYSTGSPRDRIDASFINDIFKNFKGEK